MRIRYKIFLGFFLAAATALYFLMDWVKGDVRKRYLESIEEIMVDTSNILASAAANHVQDGQVNIIEFNKTFSKVHKRNFEAKIYDITKSRVDSQIYITDKDGIVLYDSGHPENVGKDYSKKGESWKDVTLTLQGKYGVRATRKNPEDPTSLVMYIASPIIKNDKIVGVLSLYKPVNYVTMFINRTEERILFHTFYAFIIVIILGMIMSIWITRPVRRLTDYVKAVRDGKKANLPELGQGEIGVLARSFDEMREALEGKKYVEEYVQNLTHELKSPIAAVQGALELLSENNIPFEQQQKFLKNINHENLRMRRIVDRMLLLSKLENVGTISEKINIDIIEIFREIISSLSTRSAKRKITLEIGDDPVKKIRGDKILLYDAMENIISNSIDFTDSSGEISIEINQDNDILKITIYDDGAGIPDYALDKVFNKFYSLPRPGKKEKSSGLGLSITKKVIELHGGRIDISNNKDNGVTIKIEL